ncbi:MAG: cytochrome c oxidase assembly protein [Methyloceanibacter sp.]
MTKPSDDNKQQRRHGIVALSCVGLVAVMVGLSFAAVPLYRLFCQVTGYGGTPQRAEKAPDEVLDQTIRVRFDAHVDRALPWSFKPVERVIEVKIGETALAFFKASNNSSAPVTGTAIFNVSPEQAARYFAKIECFCFKQQTLAAGESMEMPVSFFIDPKLVEDEDTKNLYEITLSYTFYPDQDPGVAAVLPAGKSGS